MKLKKLFLTALLLPGTLLAADEPQTISLWPNGAPGFESRKDVAGAGAGYWVKNINNPSLTVFLRGKKPPARRSSSLVTVSRRLVFSARKGVEPTRYFNDLGIAAFVLKYRLFRETNSVYTAANAREDGLRAMRFVRSRAGEWGVDTNRIGMVGGYSAGGSGFAAAFGENAGVTGRPTIDQASARPDFIVEIYPGPLGVPAALPANVPYISALRGRRPFSFCCGHRSAGKISRGQSPGGTASLRKRRPRLQPRPALETCEHPQLAGSPYRLAE